MESKYHIITDLACRVLHFGKEACIASPGEDTLILLLKGRHILSFVSLENSKDSYQLTFEVPENDTEDFLEVNLLPYKQERLEREERERIKKAEDEAERRRIAKEEAEKKAEEQRKLHEKQEQIKIAEEQRKLHEKQEQIKKAELVKRCENELSRLNVYLNNLFINELIFDVDTPQPISGYVHKKNGRFATHVDDFDYFIHNYKSGYYRFGITKKNICDNGRFVDTRNVLKWCTEPKDGFITPFYFNRAFIGRDCVAASFNVIHTVPIEWQRISSYELGVCFLAKISVVDNNASSSHRDIIIRIIDKDGALLFENNLEIIINTYAPLDCFPFNIRIINMAEERCTSSGIIKPKGIEFSLKQGPLCSTYRTNPNTRQNPRVSIEMPVRAIVSPNHQLIQRLEYHRQLSEQIGRQSEQIGRQFEQIRHQSEIIASLESWKSLK